MNPRQSHYEIDELFLQRWSPRSFQQREVDEDTLFSLFEAARWAPSGSNVQPWRYIIARSMEDKERFLSFIMEGNVKWCRYAPVLALLISKKTNDKGKANASHAFDAGTSWGYLALEAIKKGLITHAMGGFHKDQARELLNIPEDFELHAVIAIGYQDDKGKLPEELQEREQPSERREVEEFLFEGTFPQ